MKLFPTIVAGIFIAMGVGAMLIFATYSSRNASKVGEVLVWGPLSSEAVQPALDIIQKDTDVFSDVSYRVFPEEDFIPRLVTAIAAGRGPDLIIFPAERLLSEGEKLIPIPYSALSRRDFLNTYLEAGEVLLADDGLHGVPFVLDPLVLYWNRSLFAEGGVARPPKYWDEVATQAGTLSQSDDGGTLVKSTIGLGTWDNVNHAKGVLVSMIRQLGNIIIEKTERGYVSVLKDASSNNLPTASSAVRFYTDFADPAKAAYSWNRSQPDSRTAFVSGRVALYIGRASELYGIRATNPNLNFDVATLPVTRGGTAATEARLYALSIPRGSRNPDGAVAVIQALRTPEVDAALQLSMHTPSILREEPGESPGDAYVSTFRQAALSSFVFLDPDPESSDSVFQRMIEGVTSGALTVGSAVDEASDELGALLGVE